MISDSVSLKAQEPDDLGSNSAPHPCVLWPVACYEDWMRESTQRELLVWYRLNPSYTLAVLLPPEDSGLGSHRARAQTEFF